VRACRWLAAGLAALMPNARHGATIALSQPLLTQAAAQPPGVRHARPGLQLDLTGLTGPQAWTGMELTAHMHGKEHHRLLPTHPDSKRSIAHRHGAHRPHRPTGIDRHGAHRPHRPTGMDRHGAHRPHRPTGIDRRGAHRPHRPTGMDRHGAHSTHARQGAPPPPAHPPRQQALHCPQAWSSQASQAHRHGQAWSSQAQAYLVRAAAEHKAALRLHEALQDAAQAGGAVVVHRGDVLVPAGAGLARSVGQTPLVI